MPQKDVNPLSMIPKREDLPEGRSLKDIVNSLHPEIREPVKEVGNLAKLGYDVATGEDVEGLPFGVEMIPGVSLAAKLQQGKTPGLLDFIDIPSFKGLGALKAMPPIVGTLKELKEGGRLGKTLRNIEKAKEARNFVHRVHRTHAKDAKSIENKGLLVGNDNPNYSRNTADTDRYPPSVWMGVDPTNVPVMQHYFTQQGDKGIDKTRTFAVRIPRDVYNQSPRVKWEGGRSGTPMVVWGKGNPSLSPETARWTGNQAKIDMMVGSIPKEWLSRIPQKKIHELVDNRLAREDLERQIKKYYHLSDIPRSLLDKKRLEMTSGDKLAGKLTAEERSVDNLDYLGDMLEEVNLEAKNGTGPSETPADILQNALWKLSGKNVVIGGNIPYGTTSGDLLTGTVKPTGGISPWKVSTYKGKVSRGLSKPNSDNPKERIFNWDEYRDALMYGESPWEATVRAQPQYVMNPDSYRMFEPIRNKKTASLGSISRAVMSGDAPDSWTGRLKALSEEMAEDKSGSMRNATKKTFEDLFRLYGVGDLDESTVLEIIGKSKSPTLSRLRDLNPEFRTEAGAIGRGNVKFTPEGLQRYYKDFLDEELADDPWWADPDDPEDVNEVMRRAKREAGDKLRELMKDNSAYSRTLKQPTINPFKHLRDVSTPK